MKLAMQAVSLLLAMIGVPVDTNKTPFVSEEDVCQKLSKCVLFVAPMCKKLGSPEIFEKNGITVLVSVFAHLN